MLKNDLETEDYGRKTWVDIDAVDLDRVEDSQKLLEDEIYFVKVAVDSSNLCSSEMTGHRKL